MRQMVYRKACLLFFVVLLAISSAYAQGASAKGHKDIDPAKKLTQYLLDQWTMRDGLPNNSVLDIVQGPKGYLWVATFNGLIRFDGVSFTVYNQNTHPSLTGNGILTLLRDEDGSLLVGTNGGGLLRFSGDTFEIYAGTERQTITCISRSESGDLWVGTRRGLLVYNGKSFEKPDASSLPPELVGANVYYLERSHGGELLAGCANIGLYSLNNGTWQQHRLNKALPSMSVRRILTTRNGYTWVGTDRGLLVAKEDSSHIYTVENGLPNSYVNDLMEDGSGMVWVATDRGLARIRQGMPPEVFGQEEPLAPFTSVSLLQDGEGNVWIGTYRQGLVRLKDGKFTNFTAYEGLPAAVVNAVYAEPGTVWAGTDEGLVEMRAGARPQTYTLPGGQLANRIRSIVRDTEGRLLLVTHNGLVHFDQGRQVRRYGKGEGFPSNRLRDISVDAKGAIWLGTTNGWGKWEGKGLVLPRTDTTNSPFVLFVQAGRDGRVLAGTNGGGLQVVDNDSLIVLDSSLPSNVVFEAYEDEEGLWWIGTNSGLAMMDGYEVYGVDVSGHSGSGSVFDILPDGKGYLWLMTDRGILRASRSELKEVARAGKGELKDIRLYGRADGLAAFETTGAGHGTVDSLGHLWVPTPEGLTMIEPDRLDRREYVPPVIIEKVILDDREVSADSVTALPGTQRYEIHYTGAGLYAPRKLSFFYKLEGFDNDWVEAGARRIAYYTNLSPGTYEFKVRVMNQDGVLGERVASLNLTQEAHFFETDWFYWLIGLLLLTSITGLVAYRVRSYKARNLKLEKTVKERTLAMQEQHSEIKRQSAELQSLYDALQQSMGYAARIQKAVLPVNNLLEERLEDYFVFFRPKEKISGDFYWYCQYGDALLVAAVDCTGHGVPGALMAILAQTLLVEITSNLKDRGPGDILTELDRRVRAILHSKKAGSDDGMDIALLEIKENRLRFAGARRPLLLIRNGEMEIHKGDRPCVGSVLSSALPVFNTVTIDLDGVSWAYMFSDGYADQFKEGGKKFMLGRFRQTLNNLHRLKGLEQQDRLAAILSEWMGAEEQVDDILVMGLLLAGYKDVAP